MVSIAGRLVWQGTRVWALVFAIVAMSCVVAASGAASDRLSVALDENWRGAYDLLVLPSGQDFGAGSTDGLVDPNFVGTAGRGGISLAQLDDIRRTAHVEVAAPVGLAGSLRNSAVFPMLLVTDDPDREISVLRDDTVATLTMELWDTRGVEERLLNRNEGIVALRLREPGLPLEEIVATATVTGFSTLWSNQGYYIGLGSAPEFPASIVAVDPEAESMLLGTENSRFLQPLIDAPENRSPGGWASRVDEESYPSSYMALDEAGRSGSSPAEVVPLILRSYDLESFVMRVTIEASELGDRAFPHSVGQLEEAVAQAVDAQEMTVESDVSSALTPFGGRGLVVRWPGSEAVDENLMMSLPATDLTPDLVGRPVYEAVAHEEKLSYRVLPQGITDAAGLAPDSGARQLSGTEEHAGNVQSYRDPESVPGYGFANALPAPLEVFRPGDVVDPQSEAASYVPSGLYSGNTTMSSENHVVWPNVSDQDFITGIPGAFTDLAGAQTLRGETPIDVVRVRIADVNQYDQQGVERVAEVAEAIRTLGLDVIVVAGSSPQSIDLFVADYVVHGDGTTSDLGWVSQEWTTLQAAAAVEEGVSGATTALTVASTGAVLLALTVTSLLSALGQRDHVSILRRVGWRASRITGLLVLVNLPAAVILLTSAIWGWSSTDGVMQISLGLVAVVALAAFLTAVVVPFTAAGQGEPGRNPGSLTTLPELAWKRLAAAPGATILGVAGGLISALITYFAVVGARDALAAAGSTRLAEVSRDSVLWAHLGLGLSGAGSAVMLVVIAAGIHRTQRNHHDRVGKMVGFRPQLLQRLRRLEDMASTGITVGLGTIMALGGLATGAEPLAVTAAAIVLVAILSARVMLGQRLEEKVP